MVKVWNINLKPPNAVKVTTGAALGEKTWAERDAELRSEAVDCDAD